MAQQVYNLDWFATNETVKYPIDSESSFVPIGYDEVPSGLLGVITDISFAIPSTVTETPHLSALTITDDLITLIICAGNQALFTFSSTQRSLYTGRYYDLVSFHPGCSGVIVFGQGAKTNRGAYRFTVQGNSDFLPSVYHRYSVFPVTSIGRVGNATACTGDVLFRGSGDVKVEVDSIRGSDKAILIGLDTDVNPDVLKKYLGPCDGRPESETCRRISIETISGAIPVAGDIVFVGNGININTKEGYMSLSTGYKLDDICIKDKMVQLIAENKCLVKDKKEEDEEESEEENTETPTEEPVLDCDSDPLKVNFNRDIFGSGIEISNKGITPLSGAVYLSIPVLEAKRYVGLRVTRPEEGGYFKITTNYEEIVVENLSVRVNGQEYLFEETRNGFPARLAVQIDYCNNRVRVIANNNVFVMDSEHDLVEEVTLEIKDCYLEYVEYK